MATIKGLWLFNQTIDVSKTATWYVNWYSLYGSKPSGNIIKIEDATFGNHVSFFNNSSRKFFIYSAEKGWDEGYRDYVTPISFGDTEQTVSDDFYTWLIDNAIKYATIIKHGGVQTAVETGQTGTIACAGHTVATDIVIDFATDGVITYNGVATEVSEGQTATMHCAGFKMATDVVVAVGQ